MMLPLRDINIKKIEPLLAPASLLREVPITPTAERTVLEAREAVRAVLRGDDPRFLVIVGPCSIHDEQAAREYAARLAHVAAAVKDRVLIVMRVYFEKPRTTVGWKGLINDPHLNGTFDIETGLRRARSLLLMLAEHGLPSGTEFLDPIVPQYLADLVSWAAIGARTTESQTHREMASGLSMPVGFKNGTDGDSQIAMDGMVAARSPHAFLGIDLDGHTCVVHTGGNPYSHLVLRGGRHGSNYDADTVADTEQQLRKRGLPPRILVDCSHANSEKDHNRQALAFRDVLRQRTEGTQNIVGCMLESHLFAGRQDLHDPKQLKYGVSITDACIGWEETDSLLHEAHRVLGAAATTAG